MLDIQGMTSEASIDKVYEALERIDGLTNISVSLWRGQAFMQINLTLATYSQVYAAISKLGFKADIV